MSRTLRLFLFAKIDFILYFCNKILQNSSDKIVMAQSSIITGQYVELTQTPASVGDRLIAAIIDYVVLGVYSMFVQIKDKRN